MAMTTLEPAAGGTVTLAAPQQHSVARAALAKAATAVRAAPASLAIVAVLIAVWCVELVVIGQVRGTRRIGYLAIGALPNAEIIGRGSPAQWWRFVASALDHDKSNPLHLLVNCAALLMAGSVIERYYGRLVMLATLVLGVVVGGATWMAASALGLAAVPDYTIGCSAGVSALIGMILVYGYRERSTLERSVAYAMRAQATLGISLMVLIGLIVPNLNNVAHAGGLCCGAVLAVLLPTRSEHASPQLAWRTRALLGSSVALALVSVAFAGANLFTRLTAHS